MKNKAADALSLLKKKHSDCNTIDEDITVLALCDLRDIIDYIASLTDLYQYTTPTFGSDLR